MNDPLTALGEVVIFWTLIVLMVCAALWLISETYSNGPKE